MLGLGRYEVTVRAIVFEPESQNVELPLGQRANLIFDLEPAATQLSGVEVTADRTTTVEVQRTSDDRPQHHDAGRGHSRRQGLRASSGSCASIGRRHAGAALQQLVISAESNRGTNEMRGAVFGFFQDKSMVARTGFQAVTPAFKRMQIRRGRIARSFAAGSA